MRTKEISSIIKEKEISWAHLNNYVKRDLPEDQLIFLFLIMKDRADARLVLKREKKVCVLRVSFSSFPFE